MSDTQPIDLNSALLGIGRHVSGIADLFIQCGRDMGSAVRAKPGFALYKKGGNHPIVQGSYLAALVTYTALSKTEGSAVTMCPAA